MRRDSAFLRGCTLAATILFFAPGATFAQVSASRRRITEPIDETKLTTLRGNTHPLARPEFDRGAAPLSLPMERMLLVVKRSPEQEAALDTLLEQQQDASSPDYHVWLTPEQFGQQFGPSGQDIQTVTSWLQSHGFQVARVSNGRTVIEFSGSAGQVRAAFHTEIHRYTVNGEDHWANASDPQIPSALSPVVAGIATLHNFRKHSMHHVAGVFAKSQRTGNVEPVAPEFTFTCGTNPNTGQPITCYPLAPYDFATIYNLLPLWNATSPTDGTGQTIAIVGRTNINPQDVSDFRSLFGLPPNQPHIILDGPDPGLVPGDETEADLDVEWSGAVAKGATIDLVVSQSTETSDGVDLSAVYIVDNNLAPVVSESYGQCELNVGTAGNQFENNLWQQAAAQGMTVFVSTGDDGSAGCDFFQGNAPQPAQNGLEVNGLASTPYNVAVGGTDFNDFFNPTNYWNATNDPTTKASAKSYIPETTWDDSCTNPILGNPQIGFSTNAETNCNDFRLQPLVLTIGGSGGASKCTAPTGSIPSSCAGGYPKPAWQTGAGVPSDGKRDLPDVSLFASDGFVGNFYMMCEADFPGSSGACSTSNFIGVGGTSAASPAFAGILALVNQATGSRQGNANYVLYTLAAQSGASCTSAANPASTCVFYDVPSGSTIAMPCAKGSPNCNTTNSSDSFGVLSGYSTTAGYDLATGLGSVNAANLISKWKTFSLALKPSSTTLTLNSGNPINITHGASVPVNISVAPTSGSGTPTGNVSLVANTGPDGQQGVQGLTLTGGTCSGSPCGTVAGATNALPGGTYDVAAHYSGDATFAASDSTGQQVTVNPEASQPSFMLELFDPATGRQTNANATTAQYGSLELVRINVTSQAGDTCVQNALGAVGCPTGSVTVTNNGSPLDAGTYQLNSLGYAEDQTAQLPGGTDTLKVTYGGDNSFLGSTGTSTITITQAPTTTTASTPFAHVILGGSNPLNASIASTGLGAGPTGQVTFFSGATRLGSPVPVTNSVSGSLSGNPQAQATLNTSQLSLGNNSITAQYSGDGNYAASTSPPINVDVQIQTGCQITSSNLTINHGSSVTFTATVTPTQSGGPGPTGNVVFSNGGFTTLATVPLVAGQAQFTTSSLPGGNDQINAQYPGDTDYWQCGSSLVETVNLVATTASLTTSNATIQQGNSVTLTATVAPVQSGGPTLTGTVQFFYDFSPQGSDTYIGSAVPLSNGQAQVTTTSLPANIQQVGAFYSGDSNYATSSATIAETVTPVPTFSVTANPTTINILSPGQSGSTTLTFTAQNGFSGSATLASSMCSGLPTESSCSFNPSTVTLAANGTAQTTLTIMTTAPSAVVPAIGNPPKMGAWRHNAGAIALACLLLCLTAVAFAYRGRQRRWGLALVFTAFALVFASAGCGGGGGGGGGNGLTNPGTPTGSKVITVTITVNGVTQTVPNLTVNVQ